MVAAMGRAGVRPFAPSSPGFARPGEHAQGNDLPAFTGRGLIARFQPGPGPASPGYIVNGQLGTNDIYIGADPDAPKIPPVVFLPGDPGAGMDSGTANNPEGWRGGIQGFNDKLTVKDRHAFWDTGNQRTGLTFNPASANPNTYNDPAGVPPTAELRTVNRTVSYQKGTDTSRNQDDLSRPYTWLGEQGSGWAKIWGGVPGLFMPYGSRGGVPYPIHDPTDGQGGPETVWAGPPHGLHSLTYPDYGDTLKVYQNRQQMTPVRVDRPSNSPQAGQSYSQTVQFQGMTAGGASQPGGSAPPTPGLGRLEPRGWKGRRF